MLGVPEDVDPAIQAKVEKAVAHMKEKVTRAWESPVETLARTMNQFYSSDEEDEEPERYSAPTPSPMQSLQVPSRHTPSPENMNHEDEDQTINHPPHRQDKELPDSEPVVRPPSNHGKELTASPSSGPPAEQLKAQLQALIEMIASANSMDELYTPALEKVFENVELDDMTKSYLAYNFTRKKKEKVENIERPVSRRMSASITQSGTLAIGSFLPFMSEERKRQLLDSVYNSEFQAWNYSSEELYRFLIIIFEDEFDILTTFDISEDIFYRYYLFKLSILLAGLSRQSEKTILAIHTTIFSML
jgi:hypothetical protein